MTSSAIKRFLVIFIGLFGTWYLLYEFWLSGGFLDILLNQWVGKTGTYFLQLWGYEDAYFAEADHCVYLGMRAMVSIGAPCNGLDLYVLYACFLIASPGPWQRKLWLIPLGIIGIFLINALRIAILTLNVKYAPEYVDFNHHYLFTFLVYGFIFLIWMYWINKHSFLAAHRKTQKKIANEQ
ncbi:MAG: archaeosortase/exosortase family protein [Bernardetiaceae bacterium]|nr:archaeosortase/exosortase family protein [Bernardetiaceae bacterium]